MSTDTKIRNSLKLEFLNELPDRLIDEENDHVNPATHEPQKKTGFFPVPHNFEEKFGKQFTPYEKYFYTTLCKLKNRLAGSNEWFWHTDAQFREDGFKRSKLCEMRKKFVDTKLIETRPGRTKSGARGGTEYKVNTNL